MFCLLNLKPWINECGGPIQAISIFCPDALVNGIGEVGGFFGEDGLFALGAFVFFKLAIFLYDFGVVHGDKGVFTVFAVEDYPGIIGVAAFEDVGP